MELAGEAVLPFVVEWVELVAPMAAEIEPLGRRMRCDVRGTEFVGSIIVGVGVGIE